MIKKALAVCLVLCFSGSLFAHSDIRNGPTRTGYAGIFKAAKIKHLQYSKEYLGMIARFARENKSFHFLSIDKNTLFESENNQRTGLLQNIYFIDQASISICRANVQSRGGNGLIISENPKYKNYNKPRRRVVGIHCKPLM